ncbi:hypothetical protein [Parasediminibacterium sp. JCM 36343]
MGTSNIKIYDFARAQLKLSESDARKFIETMEDVVAAKTKAATSCYKKIN